MHHASRELGGLVLLLILKLLALGFFLLLRLSQKVYFKVLDRSGDPFELAIYEFELLNELRSRRRLSELNCFDIGRLKLLAKDHCSLDLEHIVS